MSLLFITLGGGQETMYHNVLPLLKYTITNTASLEVKSEVSRYNLFSLVIRSLNFEVTYYNDDFSV